MTLFVTFELDSPALETAVRAAPDIDLSVDGRTMTADGSFDLTAWASGEDTGAFEDGLDTDDTVVRWFPIGRTDAGKLYRIRLTQAASSRMDFNGWTDGLLVPLSSGQTGRGWVVNAFVPDRTVLQALTQGCEANDVTFELVRASEVDRLHTRQVALTDLQTETLLTAFDQGFFSVPRQVNLEELADPLDVSHQALSERLRRGVNSLIETTIAHQRDSELHGTPVRRLA